ncbi:RNA polymerase sigma-70 factor [Reichenbachiella sp. MALMAid0571]|uniref:RNA polymerase sigma-70 factor n=1 Tax=Reichenbachiella sp. MALMAid0571 TaxID=3143939 RepID=UPI0032E019E1
MVFTKDDLKKIALHGDQDAFKRMFHQFYGKLLGLARYYVRSNELAEEVVNDVFVKVWDKRQKMTEVKKLESYLYTLVKNHSLNQIRFASGYQIMTIDNVDLEIRATHRNPEEQLLSKEMLSVFESSVAALPEKCNLVYRMVKDDGMTYKEVAKMLDISVKMVEKHVGTALKRIRLDMDDYTNQSGTNFKNLIYTGLIIVSNLIF